MREVGTANRGLKRAFEFLRELIFGKLRLRSRQLRGPQNSGLRSLQNKTEPTWVALSLLMDTMEIVVPLRGADENGPTTSICESGPDDLRIEPRMHVSIFIEHDAIEVDAAQGIRVICAIQPDLSTIRIINSEFGDRDDGAERQDRCRGGG